MVKHLSGRLDATFHALADPTRRGMLASLALEEMTISDLAAPYEMSLAAASKHVKNWNRLASSPVKSEDGSTSAA